MRVRLSLSALAVAALLLVGCGGDGSDGSATVGPTVPADTDAPTAGPQEPAGDGEEASGPGVEEGTPGPEADVDVSALVAAVEADGACGLIPPDDAVMMGVFAGGVPDGVDASGGDWHECVWEVPEDEMISGGHLVSVVIGPAAEVEDTLTSKATVVAPASGIPGGQMYDGVLGRGRASTKGYAVGFVSGDLAGIVSVSTAADSQPVDGGAATQLVESLLGLD